jgi:hypothetical protein
MQLAHRRRNGHRKDLLERQRTLRSTPKMHYHYPTSSSSSPEEKLRRTSRKYSKASTEFALFLAVCDSLVIQHSVGDDDVVPVHDERPNVVQHGDNDCDCEKDCEKDCDNDCSNDFIEVGEPEATRSNQQQQNTSSWRRVCIVVKNVLIFLDAKRRSTTWPQRQKRSCPGPVRRVSSLPWNRFHAYRAVVCAVP